MFLENGREIELLEISSVIIGNVNYLIIKDNKWCNNGKMIF